VRTLRFKEYKWLSCSRSYRVTLELLSPRLVSWLTSSPSGISEC
jgi:hypothetical protein